MKTLFFAAAAALASSSAIAQQTPPPPPCQDEIYRAFDFWVGEWEVTAPTGQVAGENSITIEENGCLLVERWKGVQGSTGQSYNFVDRETGKWRQVWVSPGITIDYSGGLDENGAMVLEGSIGYGAGVAGNGAKFKGTWALQDDGTVKQHFQQYDAEKKEWSDWFIGIYAKKDNE
jgi:hypothetical protein